jgi:hypothetical protein
MKRYSDINKTEKEKEKALNSKPTKQQLVQELEMLLMAVSH